MKAKISQLMDGELAGQEVASPLAALREDGEAREAWRTYHLISDALRDTRMLSRDFAARIAMRLAEEPTVLAPAAQPEAAGERGRRFLVPAAAAAAAVAMVSWVAFTPQETQRAPAPVAQAPRVKPAAPKEPARVPLPVATDDYLFAHQGYSPRNLLPGVAPYVRTVSGETAAGKP
jgi:sigma-E factor negative regulatory protein RseA